MDAREGRRLAEGNPARRRTSGPGPTTTTSRRSTNSASGWSRPSGSPSNPLAGIERLNAETDVRHKRRALTPDEVARLVEAARESGCEVQGYDGEMRARIYLISFFTGLRRLELASLTPNSFKLDDAQPTLTVEAACSKHRRKDTLPMHPELVALVREWIAGIEPDEPLFPRLARKKTYTMVQKDLERAGIPYETHEGLADFHAAGRHSHITGLVRSGASIMEAKELARHADIRQTAKYTHIGMEDRAEALAALPFPLAPAVVVALVEDADLQAMVTAWPGLPVEIRRQIRELATSGSTNA